MRSNLTILEQNTLLAFEHDDTKALYLRSAQKNEIKAFYCALEWEKHLRGIKDIIKFAANQHNDNPHVVKTPEEITEEMMDFMRERQFRRYFPNQ